MAMLRFFYTAISLTGLFASCIWGLPGPTTTTSQPTEVILTVDSAATQVVFNEGYGVWSEMSIFEPAASKLDLLPTFLHDS
jgi:hypothetical protein